jgi:hypothetical protein
MGGHCSSAAVSRPWTLQVLAPYLLATQSTGSFLAHALFAHWLLVNVAFNYAMVITTSPGTIPIVPVRMGMQHRPGCTQE